ncbi:Oidioi.mRNA.OKI2018_I69.XSR.g17025.t1.cds [Oikopleura dioica]|uniref:Oidioi.mRNA.OKI2018_I69.XSR.g17025.t1.cds n=1 Tax=Oikopleura dioica TaxID=34765 RepID=A0ABN7SIG2_OIKDI|nr:Oidioi.mRNA.OKI2018_I69.XSR.g17025.t1.cds [Oikopleura dioica]
MMAQPHGLYAQPMGGYYPQQMQYPQQHQQPQFQMPSQQVQSYVPPVPSSAEYEYPGSSFGAPKSDFGKSIKDHGIPTAKDGRVDTNRAARLRKMMKNVMLKSSKSRGSAISMPSAPAAPAPAAPPAAPQIPAHPVVPVNTPPPIPQTASPAVVYENHGVPQTVLPPSVYHVDNSQPPELPSSNISNILATEENELLFLVFISVAGVSLICILALALYLLKRRRRSAEISVAEDGRFEQFKDPGPLSSHSSYIDPGNLSCREMETKKYNCKNIPAPKDFMDKKDIEMVRTLSRAPAQEELYRIRSNESKDSGFSNSRISRKVSYIAQLKT